MTPRDIIQQARFLTLDTDSVVPRQSDPELLSYVNEALREACILRPDLFSTVGTVACVDGQSVQSITTLDAVSLLDVLCVHDGAAVTPMDKQALDLFRPVWRSDAAAPAAHWAPVTGDPQSFFIYPKAPSGQSLDVQYIRNPGTYALDDAILDLPLAYQPALADYAVYRAESKDDEHVLSQRAAAHYAAFRTTFGASSNGATVSQ